MSTTTKSQSGENNPRWKGGRTKSHGYIMILHPGHHRANATKRVPEEVLLAEKVLGKPLSAGHPIHHVNGIKSDNRHDNLVVCQDKAYHMLLHRRSRAYYGSGHADWRRCSYCKTWDDPKNMFVSKNGTWAFHMACSNARLKVYYQQKKRERNQYQVNLTEAQ